MRSRFKLRSRWAALAIALATAIGVTIATAGPAAAAQPNQVWFSHCDSGFCYYLGDPSGGNDSWMSIHDVEMSRCMDVSRYQFWEGKQLQMWGCNTNASNRSFLQKADGQGYWSYQIWNGAPAAWCFDAQQGWDFNGAPVVIHECNTNASDYGGSQEWWIGPGGQLVSVSTSAYKCADVTDGKVGVDGAKVQLWACNF